MSCLRHIVYRIYGSLLSVSQYPFSKITILLSTFLSLFYKNNKLVDGILQQTDLYCLERQNRSYNVVTFCDLDSRAFIERRCQSKNYLQELVFY